MNGVSIDTPGILPADAATIIGREVRAEADRTREQLGAEATLADYIVDAVRRLSSLLRSDAAPVASWEHQDDELTAKRQQLLDQAHAAEKAGYITAAAKLYERADEVRGDG